MKKNYYDVIVIGAGTAGCIAAIQAARAGAKTLLVEKNGVPGGTTTCGGVDFPGLFHAWGKQVIAGIGWELVTKCVAAENAVLPDFTDYRQPHWKLQVRINHFLYSCLLDEAFAEAGVDVIYHSMPAAVIENPDTVEVSLCGLEGISQYSAAILIDAGGDAGAVARAGYELRRNAIRQPATPMIRLGGYDLGNIDLELVEKTYHQAMADGHLLRTDTGMSGSMAAMLHQHGSNCIHVAVTDPTTSRGRSRTEIDGRAAVLRIYRFLRQFPGLENLRLELMAPECGIREGATIIGATTITVNDYNQGKVWDDSLCYSFYPIDLHLNDHKGLLCQPLRQGIVPTIPRSAMIPLGSQRIMAAGRCISSDQLANSALRVQATCMAVGQTAGALAALAARQDAIPAELPVNMVKDLLRKHHAIVP